MEVPVGQQALAQLDLLRGVAAVAKAEDVAVRPAQALEALTRLDQVEEPTGLVVLGADVVTEAALTAEGQVELDLEAERRLSALELASEQIGTRGVAIVVVEGVGRLLLERGVQSPDLAEQDRRAHARCPQHLVSVPDDRVGELDSAQELSVVRREQRRRAVGGVDVKPDPLCSRQKRPTASRSSCWPVLVAQAAATSATGRRPCACTRSRALPRRSGRMRSNSSTSRGISARSPRPSMATLRLIE